MKETRHKRTLLKRNFDGSIKVAQLLDGRFHVLYNPDDNRFAVSDAKYGNVLVKTFPGTPSSRKDQMSYRYPGFMQAKELQRCLNDHFNDWEPWDGTDKTI